MVRSPWDAATVASMSDNPYPPDNRTVTQRLGDALAESRREDTSTDFRLGLLQGALDFAMPMLAKRERKTRKARARRHA